MRRPRGGWRESPRALTRGGAAPNIERPPHPKENYTEDTPDAHRFLQDHRVDGGRGRHWLCRPGWRTTTGRTCGTRRKEPENAVDVGGELDDPGQFPFLRRAHGQADRWPGEDR